MTARRAFLKQSSMLGMGILVSSRNQNPLFRKRERMLPSLRIPFSARRFYSPAVEKRLKDYQKKISGSRWFQLLDYCFPQTLDERVSFTMKGRKPDTIILSENLMGLEDSTLQAWNYVPLCKADKKLNLLIEGLLRRQWQMIDESLPYSAFRPASGQNPGTLCFPLLLAHRYWKEGADRQFFDAAWKNSLRQTLAALSAYSFHAGNQQQFMNFNGLIINGHMPVQEASRDSLSSIHFNIATNLLIAGTLEMIGHMLADVSADAATRFQCHAMATGIRKSISLTSTLSIPGFGTIYASESALSGHLVCMERPDIRGVISLPVINDMFRNDMVYQNTRLYALSMNNPLSCRNPQVNRLNPAYLLEYLLKGLTSCNQTELNEALEMLRHNSDETGMKTIQKGYLHSLSAGLIMYCDHRYPGLLGQQS